MDWRCTSEKMSHDRPDVELTQIVATYIAGEVVGALTQSVIGDVLGRKRFMGLMCVIVSFVCFPICALAHISSDHHWHYHTDCSARLWYVPRRSYSHWVCSVGAQFTITV